jgi:NAD(P)-dependent dehydrogenase (short-subunit alcohol dehydrogenase family)
VAAGACCKLREFRGDVAAADHRDARGQRYGKPEEIAKLIAFIVSPPAG